MYGTITSWNTLAYGVQLAMANAGTTINCYGISGQTASASMIAALGELEAREVYSMGMLGDFSTLAGTVSTHVTTQSNATNKKERIAFVNKEVPFEGTEYLESSSERATTATAVQTSNVAHGNRRLFSVFPEAVYVEETRHISTINPTWIANSFARTSQVGLGLGELVCMFKSNVTINSIAYTKGQKITSAV